MSDDDAFVRAMSAEPLDDAPRLVWADRLDDTGRPDEAARLRAAVADPDFRFVAAVEPAMGRDPHWVGKNGIPFVGVRRGHVEYVRMPVGMFVGALDILAGLPVLVVDLMNVAPSVAPSVVTPNPVPRATADLRYWRGTNGGLSAPAWWYEASPSSLPRQMLPHLTEAVKRGSLWYYSDGGALAYPWDVSRAAVRWLREVANLRPPTVREFQAAETKWAGFTLEAMSTGAMDGMPTDWPGVGAYNADLKESWERIQWGAFGCSFSVPPAANPNVFAYPGELDPGDHWSNCRARIADRDGRTIARKVADYRRFSGIDEAPGSMDRLARGAYVVGLVHAYRRELAAINALTDEGNADNGKA